MRIEGGGGSMSLDKSVNVCVCVRARARARVSVEFAGTTWRESFRDETNSDWSNVLRESMRPLRNREACVAMLVAPVAFHGSLNGSSCENGRAV